MGYFIIPDDNILMFFIMGNEIIKVYRLWQEGRAMDKKFEADIKKWQDEANKWQITGQN